MDKFLNKKILATIFLGAGIIIISVVFLLLNNKNAPVKPEVKPEQELPSAPFVPDGEDNIIVPENEEPEYISSEPSEQVGSDDGYDTTLPEDGSTPEDTSGFPKPGDNNVAQKSEEFYPLKETLYKEIFDDPIDPNTEPGKHKEVYEKIQEIVHFIVKYPTWLPEGFVMTEVKADEGGILETGRYYGLNIITYETEEDKKIEIMEGIADMGAIENIEEVEIQSGVMGMLWKWRGYDVALGLTVYSGGSIEEYQYYIIGENVDKIEMINVAKNLKSL